MQSAIQIPYRYQPPLAVIAPCILDQFRRPEIEILRLFERQTPFADIAFVLRGVEADIHFSIYARQGAEAIAGCQVANAFYTLSPVGRRASRNMRIAP